MKHLTLIRHAKSSRDQPGLPDHLRPLNDRGRRDAPAIGRYLAEHWRLAPDIIVSSPANRTIATARAIAAAIGFDEWQIQQDERIYEAPVSALVEVIHDQPDTQDHLCLVGHNPGIENLANWLCGERVVTEVVTGAVILLELDLPSWAKVNMGKARLREYLTPALIGLSRDGD